MAQLILGVELVEINGEHDALRVNTEFSEITPEIEEKIEQKIKEQFTTSLKILRDCNSDVIGVGQKFFKDNRREFVKFM